MRIWAISKRAVATQTNNDVNRKGLRVVGRRIAGREDRQDEDQVEATEPRQQSIGPGHRRLILVGTGPRGADMSTSKSAEIFAGAYDPAEHLWLAVHFSPSLSSRAAGFAFLKRKLLRQDRDPEVSEEAAATQREAINKYYAPAESVLDYLKEIRQPTMIVQGSNDIIVPTVNSYILQQNLPNAELIVYPDANHGSFYQYPELFVSQADQFLTSALQDDDAKLQPPERLPFPSIVSAAGI